MSQIQTDINLHDLTMLVLNRSDFASPTPNQLAVEIAHKYIDVRKIILDELKKNTTP